MVITRIAGDDVLADCRQLLGLPTNQQFPEDGPLLAGLLRRSAGIHCPCSRATLSASLLECLQYLTENDDLLSDRIDAVIEGLIVGGDLLELNDVVIDDVEVRGTWVFAAPPSFVVRPSGGIFLFGTVPDQDTFLPLSLSSRIAYDGFTRMIAPQPDEDLIIELREQGLQQLSEDAWLKSPKNEVAADVLRRFEHRLSTQSLAGTISNLEILDPVHPVTYYRGRWTIPKDQNGTYVARRPQEFGAPIWCFVVLENGEPVRLLDLPLGGTRWRGCDAAWHLQMAIDSCRHNPQRYRCHAERDGIRFDFFSPLPQWSQRRLMIFGKAVDPKNCLISYRLPSAEAQTEEQFLQERLWLLRLED
ncbi:hypothetical protein [Desulfolutivibrio sp.]|uniref:hypothetical protein n=1 Tax=Desulfolutivibrio sp. TaxID=2773296 RepID=UPI002F965CBD